MVVQPFHVSIESSTRKDPVEVGVSSKLGYLEIKVFQRERGKIKQVCTIKQYTTTVDGDNPKCLWTDIRDEEGVLIHTKYSEY